MTSLRVSHALQDSTVSSDSPAPPASREASTLDMQAMTEQMHDAVTLLKLMGNPDRLLLLCQLSLGEKNVGELETLTGIVQPSLSQQLGVLRRRDLVATRSEGKYVWYRLVDARTMLMIEYLHDLFCKQGLDQDK